MARIAGIDLPREKRIETGLTYIYGIGPTVSRRLLGEAGIDPAKRVRELDELEVGKLNSIIQNTVKVEGDLRREVSLSIKRLIEIGSYRGMRHRRNLPVRGQRRLPFQPGRGTGREEGGLRLRARFGRRGGESKRPATPIPGSPAPSFPFRTAAHSPAHAFLHQGRQH